MSPEHQTDAAPTVCRLSAIGFRMSLVRTIVRMGAQPARVPVSTRGASDAEVSSFTEKATASIVKRLGRLAPLGAMVSKALGSLIGARSHGTRGARNARVPESEWVRSDGKHIA
jgi:hypothetical protein